MPMIRIAIYDDHPQRCASLKALLSQAEGMECVGAFPDCSNVIEDMRALQPDIVLMDIEMPVVDGINGVRKIKKEFPQIRIIMQTIFEDEARIFASLQAGAEGYLLKNTTAERMILSIKEVHEGGASMTPSVALRVIKHFELSKAADTDVSLTKREKEVLAFLADGNSYKMIAGKMEISYFTVNTHIRNIYEKLHVHCVGEAVSMAIKNKLI